METKENWVKTAVVAILAALLLGVFFAGGFSFLWRIFMSDETVTFLSVLPVGLVLGITLSAWGVYLRVVPYKLITESMTFEDKTVFLATLRKAVSKMEYRPRSEGEDLRIFECPNEGMYKRDIVVKLEGNSATLVGPKASLKELREALQK